MNRPWRAGHTIVFKFPTIQLLGGMQVKMPFIYSWRPDQVAVKLELVQNLRPLIRRLNDIELTAEDWHKEFTVTKKR